MGLEAKTWHLELHCAHELHSESQSLVEVVQVQHNNNSFILILLKSSPWRECGASPPAGIWCGWSKLLLEADLPLENCCVPSQWQHVVSLVAGVRQCLSSINWLLILSQASPHLPQKLQDSEVSTGGLDGGDQSVQSHARHWMWVATSACFLRGPRRCSGKCKALLVWGWQMRNPPQELTVEPLSSME